MQTILARKSISMTELREPAKALSKTGDTPVAIMNRNQVIGYFVPVTAISPIQLENASKNEVKTILQTRKHAIQPTLKYLEDK